MLNKTQKPKGESFQKRKESVVANIPHKSNAIKDEKCPLDGKLSHVLEFEELILLKCPYHPKETIN